MDSIISKMKQEIIGQNRITWLDNVKGILIFLVVFGHIIARSISEDIDIFGISQYLIYSVHMPMFISISGYLSKHHTDKKKILRNYIVPYILFDIFYVMYTLMLGNIQIYNLNILIPSYVYWYILCLVCVC